MRKRDLEKFNLKYTDNISFQHLRFAKVIGVNLDATHIIQKEVFQDLDPKSYGISWWRDYSDLDWKRRVLISDQLWQSLSTIQQAIIEAKLHLLELFDQWDQEDLPMSDAVKLVNGELKIELPARLKPSDELAGHLAALHLKGFFGSLCSTVDCLSAGIVGVLGVRMDLIKVGYPGLNKHIREKFRYANESQQEWVSQLAAAETSSGPAGWLDWMMDYRNMSTHRGRRLEYSSLVADRSGHTQIPKTKVVRYLPRNPAVSEMESLKDRTLEIMRETEEVTLDEVLNSTIKFIEYSATVLTKVWKARRGEPGLITQPKEQWPCIRQGAYRAFEGFKPALSEKIDKIVANESMIWRMAAASLAGDEIENWSK